MKYFILFYLISFFSFAAGDTSLESLASRLRRVTIGGRVQGVLANVPDQNNQDMYLRRLRLNISYKLSSNQTVVYDIRNDRANYQDSGDQKFSIGDAYWQVKINKPWLKNIRLFRAKVDVSYSQTSSSKDLFNPGRALVTDHASDFVIFGRRAVNIQANGQLGDVAYQVVLSDGVSSDSLSPIKGKAYIESISGQNLTYGAKFRYFLVGSAVENKVQDTFYGNKDTFSIGAGYFVNDKIKAISSGSVESIVLNRSLGNIEVSYSQGGFRFIGEYFLFKDNIINLDESSIDLILGKANGHYSQLEYVYKKWAPYIGYEHFDQWDSEIGYEVESYVLGVNYYEDMDLSRYGIAYKKEREGASLTGKVNDNLYAYVMMNF